MRRLLAFLAVVLPVVLVVAPVVPAGAWSSASVPIPATAPKGDANEAGAQRLAACLQSGRSLSALFLLDASGSLGSTDPNGLRYEGLEAAMRALTQLTERADFDLDVAVAAFDDQYYGRRQVVDWTGFGGDTNDEQIRDIVDRAKAGSNSGGGTDFQVALEGARQDLADRAGRGNCRVILWFTDGVNESTNPRSWAELCLAGGLVDQMRSEDITIVGLHLKQNLDPDQVDQLPAIALGGSGAELCGKRPVPEGSAPGMYLSAQDAGDLSRLFGSVISIIEGCTPTGALGSVVDPGIRRVRINVDAGKPVDSVRLDGPGGEQMVVPTRGGFQQDGYRTDSTESDGFISMVLTLPPGGGVGKWVVSPTGVPVTPDQIDFCVFADVALVLDKGSFRNVNAGSASQVGITATTPEGQSADLSVYRAVAPAASMTNAKGDPLSAVASLPDPASGKVEVAFTPAPTDARVDLAAKVALRTKSGLRLTPLTGDWGVPVNLSIEYPVVDPRDVLMLSDAVNLDPARGIIVATGSPRGPTKVCLEGLIDVVMPEDAANATVDVATGCLDLDANQQVQVEVQVTPEQAAEGAASGVIPVELRSAPKRDGTRGTAAFDLPVQWRFTNPIQIGLLIWVMVAVAATSVLLPLLAIWVANWLTARFDVDRLRWASFRVESTMGHLRRESAVPGDEDGSELLDPTEFRSLNPPGSRRSHAPGLWGRKMARQFSISTPNGELAFSARTPRSPFRYPWFEMGAPNGTRVLGNIGSAPKGDGRSADAVGGLEFVVALIVPDAELRKTAPVGSLVVLTRSAQRDYPALEQRVRQAVAWAASLDELRGLIGESDAAGGAEASDTNTNAPADPWASEDETMRGDTPPNPW